MSTQVQTIDYKKIALGGVKGIAVAVVVNVVLFFAFSALGVLPSDFIVPQADNKPLTVVPVIISSIFPLILGTLVFMALAKFTKQPVKIFGILSLVLVILSLGGPFSIPKCAYADGYRVEYHAPCCGLCYLLGLEQDS